MSLRNVIRSWLEWRRYRKLPFSKRQITFYSEGRNYLKYLQPVIERLVENHGVDVCYVTSEDDDTHLLDKNSQIHTFRIPSESVRILFFQSLDTNVLAMTMPDLESFHIKRSRHPVHYAYIHHSVVSTHMIYNATAFDHFDSILCVGPHHVEETRKWETRHGLKEKSLHEHGYAPIDSLLKISRDNASGAPSNDNRHILVAPTWGPNGLLETVGEDIVAKLLEAEYRVTVRPHPRTRQLTPQVIESLTNRFSGNPDFSIETSIAGFESLLSAAIMISDWSGAAMEFAFGLEKPVLYIDLPAKVNNPAYTDIDSTPIESFIRNDIGTVLQPDNIDQIANALEDLLENREEKTKSIRASRDKWMFNVDKSDHKGAEIIYSLLTSSPQNTTGSS